LKKITRKTKEDRCNCSQQQYEHQKLPEAPEPELSLADDSHLKLRKR
jgi:hypothetical protein